jgi:hypothetical protein
MFNQNIIILQLEYYYTSCNVTLYTMNILWNSLFYKIPGMFPAGQNNNSSHRMSHWIVITHFWSWVMTPCCDAQVCQCLAVSIFKVKNWFTGNIGIQISIPQNGAITHEWKLNSIIQPAENSQDEDWVQDKMERLHYQKTHMKWKCQEEKEEDNLQMWLTQNFPLDSIKMMHFRYINWSL